MWHVNDNFVNHLVLPVLWYELMEDSRCEAAIYGCLNEEYANPAIHVTIGHANTD